MSKEQDSMGDVVALTEGARRATPEEKPRLRVKLVP